MVRTKKIVVIVSSDVEEREWIATTLEGHRIEERHPNPTTAVGNLSRALREKLGEDIEIEYELKLPPSLQSALDELEQDERDLKELTTKVKVKRYHFASRCLDRRIKQHDIGEIMHLSQSYINTVIRTKGLVTTTGTGDRILSRRRRTDV
jgi:hypothetical protein